MTDTPYHIPALLPQCLEALDIKAGGIYIDCTLGGGGHTRAIARCLAQEAEKDPAHRTGTVFAFDRDTDAIDAVTADPHPLVRPVHANFRHIVNFARYHDIYGNVDGVLADLGVSFHHFDDSSRGFSFRFEDAPLDMRMNRNAPLTAASLLADTAPGDLADMLRLYGEVPRAHQMAGAIATARAQKPLLTAGDLLAVIDPMVNPRNRKKELAQVFQALRIVVNDEIGALRQMLQGAVQVLKPGGRLAIITYHSLEDRLVKNFMRTGNLEGNLEKDFFGRTLSPLKPLTSKPVVPGQAEIDANPRCRSAKLRVAQKTDTDGTTQPKN